MPAMRRLVTRSRSRKGISAAVTAYVEAERRQALKAPPKYPQSAWGLSARLEMMNNRIMLQRKVFR